VDELIQQLTSKLGLDPSVAKTATDKAMALVKQHAGDDLFQKISGAIHGAQDSANDGTVDVSADAGAGSMFGMLTSLASSALGSKAGSGLELAASLSSSGVDKEKIGGFIEMIINFIKEKAGNEVVDQLLAKFPVLKTLVG
jgi:hypothetical protein